MKQWLLLGASTIYAMMSAQAAFAATPTATDHATSMAATQPLPHRDNFDASLAPPSKSRITSFAAHAQRPQLEKPNVVAGGLSYQRLRPKPNVTSYFDPVLDKPTFIWAGRKARDELDFTAYKPGNGAATYGRAYLGQFASRLQIDPKAATNARVVFVHDNGTGPVIVRYQQMTNGLEVFNRQLNVIMNQDLKLIAISGYFANAKGATARKITPLSATGPQPAMNAAFNDLGLPVSAYSLDKTRKGAAGFTEYVASANGARSGARNGSSLRLTGPAAVKKVLFPINGELVPSWQITVRAGRAGQATGLAYAYVASAGGHVFYRKDLTNGATYNYRAFADPATRKPYDSPFGNDRVPFAGQQPGVVTASSLSSVASTHGVGDPWLPIPVQGAPTDITQGNNVWTYLDVAGADGQDDPADVWGTTSSPRTFDYSFDATVQPTTPANRQTAIVSLFYLDNWLHDAWYDAGFTEATGNAQFYNYRRGGAGRDPILAEAQDFSGLNNANMSTPPDGYSPRQQMYLWTGPVVSKTVDLASTDGGGYVLDPAYAASFGPQNYDVSGDLMVYNDGVGAGSAIYDACQPTTQDLTGKIALIADIYTCPFVKKVANAKDAGAIGAIVVWNDDPSTDNGFHMGGSLDVGIPSLGVSDQDANPVIDAISAGATVTLHMAQERAPMRSGSLDAQIVSHEFFHYVSNRLVGNAAGLTNTQGTGMGEGWSDLASLFLTARANDLASNPDGYYTVGSYATSNFFPGIRVAPYTTDMRVNPLTFTAITQNPEAHFVGTVWATVLWEAYAGLYKHYASVDPGTAYKAAKAAMMKYIIEGLMATPNAPTMIEARNAILASAYATSQADYDVLATAFAKRGMGFGAKAPPRNSADLTGVKESYKTDYKAFVVKSASLDVNSGPGVCDADYSLDPGEIGHIKLTLRNIGSADLDGVTAKLSSPSFVSFGNDGVVTFKTLPFLGGQATAVAPVRVDFATRQSKRMTINVSFPDVGNAADDVTEPADIQLHFLSNQDLASRQYTDDVEERAASLYDWMRGLTGNGAGWSIDSAFNGGLGLPADNHYWYGPDNGSATELALVTPEISVGNKPFSVSFYHYFQFESSNGFNWDGGVMEISTDGGATWTDVTKAGGSFKVGYTGAFSPYNPYFAGREGFVGTGGTALSGQREAIDFGTALAGKTVQLRFVVGSDGSTGDVGWIIDDVTVKGATAPMFSVPVRENRYCLGKPPVADAGSASHAKPGDTVTLDGSDSYDPDGGSLRYTWLQLTGRRVQLHNANTAKATFTVPRRGGTRRFALMVSDMSGFFDFDFVKVKVDKSHKPHRPDWWPWWW